MEMLILGGYQPEHVWRSAASPVEGVLRAFICWRAGSISVRERWISDARGRLRLVVDREVSAGPGWR